MQPAIKQMMTNYHCENIHDYLNALKETVQKVVLLALWRAKFFEQGSFYGGTALRILYELDRYSEDMDFSLLKPDPEFSLHKYNEAIETELQSFGLPATITLKEKQKKTNIKSALIKIGAKEQLIAVTVPSEFLSFIHKDQKITIKMEVDTNPPPNFQTEQKVVLNPIPFFVNTYQKPDLFATKIHAILCRGWGTRVKGRDWYDFVWYMRQNIPLRLTHLKTRLVQSGDWPIQKPFNNADLKELLYQKLQTLDLEEAKKDVLPFLIDKASITIWSYNFFHELISAIKTVH